MLWHWLYYSWRSSSPSCPQWALSLILHRRPTMLCANASVLCSACNYTDIHIDKIFDSLRYVENGIHIRFAFEFVGSLRWLCVLSLCVLFSFANNSRFVRMWKICFYGASFSKCVSTFAVPTTLFICFVQTSCIDCCEFKSLFHRNPCKLHGSIVYDFDRQQNGLPSVRSKRFFFSLNYDIISKLA